MNSVVTAYPDALPEATSTSLSLPDTLTFEQWEQIGAELANRARKLNWWIGDWWAAGHHRYGERARLAAKGLFGKEFKTLANIASVCRAFEPSRRREHLSWSHHAEAAALSPNAADMLLDLAERDRMSKAQVRAAVTTIRGGPPARTSPDEAAVAGLFRAYNRLPGEVRLLVAQAFAAAQGEEIDPATGRIKAAPVSEESVSEASAAALAAMPDVEPVGTGFEAGPFGDGPVIAAPTIEDEPEEAFDLPPDMASDEPEAEPEPDFALVPDTQAPDMQAPQAAPEADTTFDLALEMEAPQAIAEPEIAYDLTLDMAALQGEAEAAAPFDLVEALPDSAEPDVALDLDLDMAVAPDVAADLTFDLDPAMEVAQGDEDALELEAGMEKTEEEEESSSARVEPWLLP